MPLLFLCCYRIESLFLLSSFFCIFTSLSDRFMFLLKRRFSSYELSLSLSPLSLALSLTLSLSLALLSDSLSLSSLSLTLSRSLSLTLSLLSLSLLSLSLSLWLSTSLFPSLALSLSLTLSFFLSLSISFSDSVSPLSLILSLLPLLWPLMWSNNLRVRPSTLHLNPVLVCVMGLLNGSHYPSPLRDRVNTNEYPDLFVYCSTTGQEGLCVAADQKTNFAILVIRNDRFDLFYISAVND